ncbi:MAG: hypothetical protein M0R17_06425 [Candidatus Omnitrophica bacterium]|jgi:hypothetical protein|nr:hypothetical protein [Candidatus Omnitrophota bacterium]
MSKDSLTKEQIVTAAENAATEVTNNVSTTEPAIIEPTTAEKLAAALAAGDFAEVAKLAKVMANEKKLAAIDAAAKKAEQDKKDEVAKVQTKKAELIQQLTDGEFTTFQGLWMIINTTLPANVPAKVIRTRKNSSTGTTTITGDKVTKRSIILDCLTAHPEGVTYKTILDAVLAVYPDEDGSVTKSYLSKLHAIRKGDLYFNAPAEPVQ